MAKRSAVEILTRIGLSFRRNWGLKLISLLFAVILWNYVIAETKPTATINYPGIKVTFDDNGITRLKNSGYIVSGALPDKKVNVAIKMLRTESLGPNDIKAIVDLTGITSEGLVDVKVNVTTAKGSVVSTSPDMIRIKIEKLSKRVVPVDYSYEGTLPQGYWRDEPSIKPSELTISGASTLVARVNRAHIVITLNNLKQKLSAAPNFTLLDIEGQEIDPAGLELSAPNCIVNLQVYPTKTVKIDISSSLNGSVANGYEVVGKPDVFPMEIIIAGPQEILDTIDTLVPAAPINISGAKAPISAAKLMLKLPPGVRAVGENSITVYLNIAMKMTTVIINDVHVSIDLLPGLKVSQSFTANVTISCPELFASRIKRSQVHLTADGTEFGAGNHTLTITGSYGDPEAQAEIIDISPNEIPVKIENISAP